MFKLIKRFFKFIKIKFKGSLDDRIFLLRLILICIACFSIFALSYRSFFGKKMRPINTTLHSIYDRNNNLMAYNITTYRIIINPMEISSVAELWRQIEHLNVSKEDLIEKIYLNEPFILMDNLNLEAVQGIKHRAINIVKFNQRSYPLKKNFTTLGVCNLQRGLVKGVESMAINNNVFLTIDMRMQSILASTLERAQQQCNPEVCFGIISNLKGEILAMHTTNCPDSDDLHDYFNNVLYGLFEFGSTCKIFTVLAGLFYGSFDIKTVFDTDEGKYIFGKLKHDYEPIPRFSDLFVIISKSSNRGTVAAQRKIGNKLVDFLKLLRLNEPVDLGFTQTPKPKFFKKYKNDEIAGMAYGYNFITNAFNILRAFLVIFTHGDIMNPTILQNDMRNRIIGHINSDVFDDVINLMRHTAKRHPILDKLGCVSKTGTVDRIIHGSYDSHRVNSYIVCAVPGLSGKIEYVILLCMMDPAEYSQAGVNIRSMAAKISERIWSL